MLLMELVALQLLNRRYVCRRRCRRLCLRFAPRPPCHCHLQL